MDEFSRLLRRIEHDRRARKMKDEMEPPAHQLRLSAEDPFSSKDIPPTRVEHHAEPAKEIPSHLLGEEVVLTRKDNNAETLLQGMVDTGHIRVGEPLLISGQNCGVVRNLFQERNGNFMIGTEDGSWYTFTKEKHI